MSVAIISASIGIATFIVMVSTHIIRITAKIVTLENGAKTMRKDIDDFTARQTVLLDKATATIQEHDKLLAVLTNQMADIKAGICSINDKLDALQPPRKFSRRKTKSQK